MESGSITTGASVSIQGTLVASQGSKQKVELKVLKIVTVSNSLASLLKSPYFICTVDSQVFLTNQSREHFLQISESFVRDLTGILCKNGHDMFFIFPQEALWCPQLWDGPWILRIKNGATKNGPLGYDSGYRSQRKKVVGQLVSTGVAFVPWWFTREVVGALSCFTFYQILQSLFSLSKLPFAFAQYLVVSQFNESSSPKIAFPDLGWVLCSRLALYD